MAEFMAVSRYAEDHVVRHENVPETGLRVYRDSPDTITVQVRTRTDKQGRVASVALTWAKARELVEFITAEQAERLREREQFR